MDDDNVSLRSYRNLVYELGRLCDSDLTKYKLVGIYKRVDENSREVWPNDQLRQYLKTVGIHKWSWNCSNGEFGLSCYWEQTDTCFCHQQGLVENAVIVHIDFPHRGILIGNRCAHRFGIEIAKTICVNENCDNVRRESVHDDFLCSSCRNKSKRDLDRRKKSILKLRKNPRKYLNDYIRFNQVDEYIVEEIERTMKSVYYSYHDREIARESGGCWNPTTKEWCFLRGYTCDI